MTLSIHDQIKALGQTVLVYQGAGALGAYQAGGHQALHEADVQPDWLIPAPSSAKAKAVYRKLISITNGMRGSERAAIGQVYS